MERSLSDIGLAARLYSSQLKKQNSSKVSLRDADAFYMVLNITICMYSQAAQALKRQSSIKRAKTVKGNSLEADVNEHAKGKASKKKHKKEDSDNDGSSDDENQSNEDDDSSDN